MSSNRYESGVLLPLDSVRGKSASVLPRQTLAGKYTWITFGDLFCSFVVYCVCYLYFSPLISGYLPVPNCENMGVK